MDFFDQLDEWDREMAHFERGLSVESEHELRQERKRRNIEEEARGQPYKPQETLEEAERRLALKQMHDQSGTAFQNVASAGTEPEGNDLPTSHNPATRLEGYAHRAVDPESHYIHPMRIPKGMIDTALNPSVRAEMVEKSNQIYAARGLKVKSGKHGYELWATRSFERGEEIAPYTGVGVTHEEADRLHDVYDKIYSGRKFAIVGDVMGTANPNIAAFANAPGWERGIGDFRRELSNAEFAEDANGRVRIVASRPIRAGSGGTEITINYGDSYLMDKEFYPTPQLWRDAISARDKYRNKMHLPPIERPDNGKITFQKNYESWQKKQKGE